MLGKEARKRKFHFSKKYLSKECEGPNFLQRMPGPQTLEFPLLSMSPGPWGKSQGDGEGRTEEREGERDVLPHILGRLLMKCYATKLGNEKSIEKCLYRTQRS